MRIAIINFSSSGMFHYAVCLANELTRQPATELLFLTSRYNKLDLLLQRPNLRLFSQAAPHRLPGFFHWLFNAREQRTLYRTVRDFRPDVIHLTDSHAVCVPHAWWLRRYPIVFTQHDPVSHRGDVFPLATRLIHRTEQRLVRRIVVHGEYLKQLLVRQRIIPPQKIAVIPHGDYSFYLRWRDPSIKQIPNAVLFFGRIIDYKGLDLLLHSLITLQQEGMPVTLILAGAGDLAPYQPLLRQLQSTIIDNRTIPEAEVIRYFQMTTAIALPYREASQSGIISIALPAGVPIIATRAGSLPEIIIHERNGLLVEPNNLQQLTAAIKRLLADSTLRARLIAGGLATVENKISWRRTASQYYQLYQSLRIPPLPFQGEGRGEGILRSQR